MKIALMPLATVLYFVGMLSSCSEGSKGTIENQSTDNDPTISANSLNAANGAATSGSIGEAASRTFDAEETRKPISNLEIENRYSSTYNDCVSGDDNSEDAPQPLTDCISAELRLQDARLNQAYKMVMSRLTSAEREKLRASEKLWIKTRYERCTKAMGEEAGFGMGRIIYLDCILDEAIRRTIWLERIG